MKNFKSLILGSAAAVLAVAGAQAADLPVKAKPVQYVKICSAYGAGFYYIPGTDICLRVGGYVWSDFSVNDRGINGELGTGSSRDRNDDWTAFRVRQALILDARTNTEYGTLRSYFAGGFQWDTSNNGQVFSQSTVGNWTWYYSAAFIQFAGFTFGLASSFFNFDPGMTMFTFANKSVGIAPMIAYTAQLGSGISATISMEDGTARRNQISDGGTVAQDLYSAQFMPDFIANIRVSQAWGDAQVSGAIHQVKTNIVSGEDNVDYGYAVLGGLNFKLPQIGAKDSFQIEGVWSKGAVAFTGINSSSYSKSTAIAYSTEGNAPVLDTFDAFRVSSTDLELVKAWSLNTQFRHFWTPNLRSTIGYGYLKFDAGNVANTVGGLPDGRLHQVVGNLIWSPVKNLDIGTEVYWSDLKTDHSSDPTANDSNSWWGGNFRVTRYW
jgi:hypothetical protein